MSPEAATVQQIHRYRAMDGETRLKIALNLHELSCSVAREAIRAQHPDADEGAIQEKLRQRIRAAYSSPIASISRVCD